MLNNNDKKEIIESIKKRELETCGEIITVFARKSSDYKFTCLLWAIFTTMLISALLPYFPATNFIRLEIEYIILLQIIIIFFTFFILNTGNLGVKLTPKKIRHEKASNLAAMQFYKQGLHLTKDRAAILLFVSLAEKYVEIIADKGINDVTDDKEWENIIAAFLVDVKNNKIKDAYINAIDKCGKILSKYFPADKNNNKNEMTDLLIEL